MIRTIHGWPAIKSPTDSRLRLFPIPGVPGRSLRLRRDIGGYLVAFAAEYHRKVAPLNRGTFDDWSWSPLRKGRASTLVSDHCAGIAVDLNATREGAQGRGLSWWVAHPKKYRAMRRLLRKYRHLEWGGDYRTFIDPMHVVIDGTRAQVKADMLRLGIRRDGTTR